MARNTAPAKTNHGLDHQDDASMRSKSPISSKSHLDARKSGISQEADKGKGLSDGQGKKDPNSSALFGGAPATKSGLFGKPPTSDLMRESPAFGSAKTQEAPGASSSLFGGKATTDQPGICKPKASVGEPATKTSDGAGFKRPEPPKSKFGGKDEQDEAKKCAKQNSQAQAPSGSLFGNNAAPGASSSSAEPKKTSLGLTSTTAANALFGGGAPKADEKAPEEQTASSSNIKEEKAGAKAPAANPFLTSASIKSNPFINPTASTAPSAQGSLSAGGKPAPAAAAQGATGASGFGGGAPAPASGGSLFGGQPSGAGLFGSTP